MAKTVITFSVKRNTKRPKHLENNVYTLYLPERITLRPGEHKSTDMKIGIILPQNIQGAFILLAFANERLHLRNCSTISNKSNVINSNQPFPLPWNVHFELSNKNTTGSKIFWFRKRDPMGFFVLCNDGMEEFDTKYKTLDKEGNQNNSFRVMTTSNNCRNKEKQLPPPTPAPV